MATRSIPDQTLRDKHLGWVRTRLQLESAFQEALRHGFTLISAGFGSFAIFDGLSGSGGREELPKAFALAMTVLGVMVILLASRHFRKMTAWIDADEFGQEPIPTLPDERRPLYLALAAVLIGVASFLALLRIP